MARKAGVRYYPTRNAYFTCFRGTQHKLAAGPDDAPDGPTYLAALDAFKALMELGHADRAGQGNLVRTIFDLYARHLESRKQTRSLTIFFEVARHAADEFGDVQVAGLKAFHVTEWLKKMGRPRLNKKKRSVKWGPSYQAFALRTIKAAFNWAKKQELITSHSLGGVEAHEKRSRGDEAVVPRDAFERIYTASNAHFRDLLTLLWTTGCRPDEAYHVEARYYDRVNKCVVYPGKPRPGDYVWKNAVKTGKDRIIYLTDEVAAMVEERIRRFPTGRIFRNKLGRHWRNAMVGKSLRHYAAKLGITPAPTAYGFRHTFATDWLLTGGSVKVLADLMGTSVQMIDRHYGHLHVDRAKMRSIMISVLEGRTGNRPAESAVATSAGPTEAAAGARDASPRG